MPRVPYHGHFGKTRRIQSCRKRTRDYANGAKASLREAPVLAPSTSAAPEALSSTSACWSRKPDAEVGPDTGPARFCAAVDHVFAPSIGAAVNTSV